MQQPTFQDIWTVVKSFLPGVESFIATPKWDFKQWSWGYGTRVPGSVNDKHNPPKVKPITRDQAIQDCQSHIFGDFSILMKLVHLPLKPNQWASLLSFSYNEGIGSAIKLIPDMGTDNFDSHVRQYVYAGGVFNQDLKDRREIELKIWHQ